MGESIGSFLGAGFHNPRFGLRYSYALTTIEFTEFRFIVLMTSAVQKFIQAGRF